MTTPLERELANALELMLTYYRSEGCPVVDCKVCEASNKAEAAARLALQKFAFAGDN